MSHQRTQPFSETNEGLQRDTSASITPTCIDYEVRTSEFKKISTRKKQISLFEYLPLAFQTKYDT